MKFPALVSVILILVGTLSFATEVDEAPATALRSAFSRMYHSKADIKRGTVIEDEARPSLPRNVLDLEGALTNYDDMNFDMTIVKDVVGETTVYKLMSFSDEENAGYMLQIFSENGEGLGYCMGQLNETACVMISGDFVSNE